MTRPLPVCAAAAVVVWGSAGVCAASPAARAKAARVRIDKVRCFMRFLLVASGFS
jgi:hypothetical protein